MTAMSLPQAFEWKELMRRGMLADMAPIFLPAPVFVFQMDDVLAALEAHGGDAFWMERLRLPMSACLFELVDPGETTWMFACRQSPERRIVALLFLRSSKGWTTASRHLFVDLDEQTYTFEGRGRPFEEGGEDLVLDLFTGCFLALEKTQSPIAKRPSQAERRVVSKLPHKLSWEYRIIDLTGIIPAPGAPQGGSHASPRWHMRRGHWRRLSAERQVWVRDTEVGAKEDGGVIHDYVIKPRMT
jgi:hypothetical protein